MRFLKINEVVAKVGLSRSQIYVCIKSAGFPLPVKIGAASLWLDEAVEDWMRAVVERGGVCTSDT